MDSQSAEIRGGCTQVEQIKGGSFNYRSNPAE